MRRNLEVELSPDRPGLVGRRIPKIDLAAHDHVDELVARGEPLLLDAGCIGWIFVAGIGAENGGTRVRLWIEDNGIGIKPQQQGRLFGMFERAHADKNYEGTGIGLAIVKKGIERMGGSVGLQSDGISGSQFWIELPAAKNL